MASRFVLPFADIGNGVTPKDGAQLFFFETGTSTPKNTFSDAAGTIPNTNPVVADAEGVFGDIFITGQYKVQLKDKNGVQQWEADPVDEFALNSAVRAIADDDDRYGPVFATVAAMTAGSPVAVDGTAVSLTSGMTVSTQGYTTAGGIGAATYLIKTSAEFGATPDETGDHTLGNGNIAVLQSGDVLLSSQYGANGTGDLAKLDDMLTKAAGKRCDISAMSNLSGTISGHTNISLIGDPDNDITLSGLLTFDNTNTNFRMENVHFDATAVPNGTSTAVLVEPTGHVECVHSDVQNAPRGNLLIRNCATLVGWGGDFSNAGQENFVSSGVNIGTGLHLFGIGTRGRWYNPRAFDCWQIGVFINGDGTNICNNTVVYNAHVANASDNGIRIQPEDAAYLGTQDCAFIDPVVTGSTIDNIRINGTRCRVSGGRTSNATGWGCKSDGGTEITMEGLHARGNGSGIGARVEVDLDGLIVKDCNSDNPANSPAIYCVQITTGKKVHNVSFHDNLTEGGAQSDIAIILVDETDGFNLSTSGNKLRGYGRGNYRETYGKCDYLKVLGNSADSGGGRAYINLSDCNAAAVIGYNGYEDTELVSAWVTSTAVTKGEIRSNADNLYRAQNAGTTGATAPTHTSGEVSDGAVTWLHLTNIVAWGIEANNGTTNCAAGNNAFLGASALAGGADSAQINDKGGNIL